MERSDFDILVAGRADNGDNTVASERILWKAIADKAYSASRTISQSPPIGVPSDGDEWVTYTN